MAIGNIRSFIKNNVLTTAEVSELLGVTRQRVNMLVKNNELSPIKTTTSGSIFFMADVDDYILNKKGLKKSAFFVPPYLSLFSGVTQKCLKFFEDNIDKMGEIQSIFIFFDSIDAVLNNFYLPSEQVRYGELKYIQVPHFILRDTEGKEMWLSGCNAGYGGEGPNGSRRILNMLDQYGFSQFSDLVYQYKIIKIFRDSEGNMDKVTSKEESVKSPGMLNDKATMYFWRGKPILIQDESYRYSNTLAVLERYKAFIPNPTEYIIFDDDEMAKEQGYFAPGLYNEILYKLIIIDSSGRQLWLNPFLDKNPYSQDVMEIALESCGFKIPEENVPQTILSWLKTRLRRILPAELSNRE